MDIKNLQTHWDEFGKTDPLWAIMTNPNTKNNRWDIDDFFKTGYEHMGTIIDTANLLGYPKQRGTALDFGCGVGRLTQPLCQYFENVTGIDIAPSMIKLAGQYNKYGQRCKYILNDKSDLSLFPDATFDFVMTFIVLQHMEPKYSKSYIKEFLRVLKPGGAIVFQIPTGVRQIQIDPTLEYMAEITVDKSSIGVKRGEEIITHVTIKNQGSKAWPACSVNIGNHWYFDKTMSKYDDQRYTIEKEIKPDESIEVDFSVKSPDTGGKYELEFDLVREGIAWFSSRGLKTKIIEINVDNESGIDKDMENKNEEIFTPVMETYHVPVEEIREIITENGGRILSIQSMDCVGPTFESHTFWITK